MKKLFILLVVISGLLFGLTASSSNSVQWNETSNTPVKYTLDDPDELPFPIGLV